MDLPGYIALDYPELLLAGIALAWLYARRLRHRNAWRCALLVLAILLLCRPSVIRTSSTLNVCVLVDRSHSISDDARAKQLEMLEYLRDQLEPGDQISVVSFNDQAYVEQVPGSRLTVRAFENPWSGDATDLAAGLEVALGLVSGAPNPRIFLLSDGEYTERNPLGEARLARQEGTRIYYRDLQRLELLNLSVTDVRLPDKALVQEPFRILFRVNSTAETPGRYRLVRDDRVVNEDQDGGWQPFRFQRGDNRIVFADVLATAGIHGYQLEVEATGTDQEVVANDNAAEGFVQAVGERPVLLVNNTGEADNVGNILRAGDIPAHVLSIDNYRFDIRQLEGYKAVVLNNVPILSLTRRQIDDLERFVTQEGGGLIVCGGNRSFASGGYYQTSIDRILPVAMEDRQQSKKIATAFSIVLDRSGSMAMTVPSGETKMALANHAAAECVRLMNSVDSVSVIAVDSAAHVIVPQSPVDDPSAIIRRCLSIESMGGGIFVYTGLVAAGSQIVRAEQLNKHVLLFADAADAEEPGNYRTLLEDFRKAGVTVSVVGLGTPQDVDAPFLKDVAERGGGSVYLTQDAGQLVQFFTADTLSYTRNRFLEEPVPVAVRAGARTMAPQSRWSDFTSADYNLLFARPDANVALRTADEDQAPLLAFWQRGLGRVVALALDPNRTFAQHDQYGDMMLSTVRWAMGSNVADHLQISVDYEGRVAHVRMEVSQEERDRAAAPEMIIFTPSGKSIRQQLQWSAYDQLSASFKIAEPGLHRGIVRVGGQEFKIGPIARPVSPEFLEHGDPEHGRRVMDELARVTGGARVQNLNELFDRTGLTPAVRPIAHWLWTAFLLLLLCDIAEARFGLLGHLARWSRGIVAWLVMRVRGRRVPWPARRARPAQSVPDAVAAPAKPYTPSADDGIAPSVDDTPAPSDHTPDHRQLPDMDYLRESKDKARRKMG